MQRQMKITQGGKPQKRFEASSDLVPLAIGWKATHVAELLSSHVNNEDTLKQILRTTSSTHNFSIWSRRYKIELILSLASLLMNVNPGSKTMADKKWSGPPNSNTPAPQMIKQLRGLTKSGIDILNSAQFYFIYIYIHIPISGCSRRYTQVKPPFLMVNPIKICMKNCKALVV